MVSTSKNQTFSLCLKCSQEDGDFFQLENTKIAGYCRQCFEKMVRQKFAFCFGKNRVFKDEQKRKALLVCYSNDFESLQLLRLVWEAMTDQNVHKRLRLNLQVLYLSFATSLAEMDQDAGNCRLLSQRFPEDWVWNFVHESAMLNQHCLEAKNLQHSNELFESCQSDSVRNEIKRLLRIKLICRLSVFDFQCSTVLVPDTADKLAKDVLSALCFGRVASLSQMSSMVDDRYESSIQFIRPFRDISSRELKAMQSIEQHEFKKATPTGNGTAKIKVGDASLQALTADFIQELRSGGFPATVSTILSVSTKVDNKNIGRKCTLCYDLFDLDGSNSSIDAKSVPVNPARSKEICHICIQLISDSGPNLAGQIMQRVLIT